MICKPPSRRAPVPRAASFCLFLLFLVAVPQQTLAALKAKDAPISMDEACNPRPADDDILLPMPCGASLALRAVGVQADGYLRDLETRFGCDNCDRRDREYYERRYNAAVSGPFSAGDLPSSWQSGLPQSPAGAYYYYFIGKYEISELQWQVVMDEHCPRSPLPASGAKPKSGLSWFEAVEFSRRYTEWLLRNAPDALPRFAGDSRNVGSLRLPTEQEWEYAARGGHAVPRSSFRERDFFPMDEGADQARYAVFRNQGSPAEKPLPIGSRLPNPLGLYDTAGNVAEMAMDLFHFSLGGRLHGAAGGFVRKGGSYLADASGILPGRREEVAFFLGDSANAPADLGLRLVLSGINTPAGARPEALAREWKQLGEHAAPLFDQGKQPLEEIDRLIASSGNVNEKENLRRLRGVLKDNNIALERQNAAAAEGLVRSALFMVETVRNYGVRHKGLVAMRASALKEREKARKMSAAARKAVEETIAGLEDNRAGMERSLHAAVAFYRGQVEESLAYPEALFASKLALVKADFAGNDLLSRNMRKAHELFCRHVAALRRGKTAHLDRDALINDILPENLRVGLTTGKR